MIFNVIYAKRKKHVRIYWFYHLSRRCNNPTPLTLLQKTRTTASTTEGRPSSGKQAPRSMIFLKSLAISRILCTFVGNYNIKIKQLWSYWCFFFSRYSCYHRCNRSNTKSQKNAGCKSSHISFCEFLCIAACCRNNSFVKLWQIKSTPVLTGEDAERFIREAEENERNPQRRKLLFSFEDIDRMMERSRKYLKEHGGKGPFAK